MSKCKFCEAMEEIADRLPLIIPRRKLGFSVALISFVTTAFDGSETKYTATDDRQGDGYALNFCPECGRKLKRNAVQTNYEHLLALEQYEMANAILNIGEDPCKVCPRDREDRCNEDCNNGLVEWLVAPYDPKDPVWTEC